MAEFQTKSKSPHVDMTPMVDLGFLLITFFMLATSFSQSKIIKTIAPSEPDGVEDYDKLNCNRALTLMIDESDFIKYYVCPSDKKVKADSVDFSKQGLRQLILKRQQEAKTYFNNEKKLIVLLKSTQKASYKHLIDAIDELNLTQTTFTLAKMDGLDSTYLGLKK